MQVTSQNRRVEKEIAKLSGLRRPSPKIDDLPNSIDDLGVDLNLDAELWLCFRESLSRVRYKVNGTLIYVDDNNRCTVLYHQR